MNAASLLARQQRLLLLQCPHHQRPQHAADAARCRRAGFLLSSSVGRDMRTPLLPPLPSCHRAPGESRLSGRAGLVATHAYQYDGSGDSSTNLQAPQRIFMFDPSNPDSVQEMTVQPHEDIAAAEELLQAAEEEAQALQAAYSPLGAGASGNGSGGGGPGGRPSSNGKRTPIPLRAVSPMPGRGGTTPMGQRLNSPLPQRATLATLGGRGGGLSSSLSSNGSNGNGANDGSNTTALSAKSSELQKQLVAQLEKEQGQVAHLAQYESMYREWRIKAERLDTDINMMQRLVAEKDAELAHGYRLLEASAAERSRLRHSYQAAQEQAKQLQLKLNEAQLLAGPQGPAGLLAEASGGNGSSKSNGKPGSNGGGSGAAAGAATSLPSNMQAMIEELSSLAQGLAVEMKDEVQTIARASPTRSSSAYQ